MQRKSESVPVRASLALLYERERRAERRPPHPATDADTVVWVFWRAVPRTSGSWTHRGNRDACPATGL